MRVENRIAWRYLFARKSHNVINIISAISAIGMAVGTAALILILSIYNGFDRIIRENISDLDPDVLLVSADGSKHFYPDEDLMNSIYCDERVVSVCDVLEDNVFLNYDGRQGLARAKGIDRKMEDSEALAGHVTEGSFSLHHGETLQAAVGVGLSQQLGIHPRFLSPLTIWYPDRKERISLQNPAASLHSVNVWPSCLLSVSSNTDGELLIVPIEVMRTLLGSVPDKDSLSEEVTGVEVRLRDSDDRSVRKFIRDWSGKCEGKVALLSRTQLHPDLYKMMKYEKFALYLILVFVVIIIALNIFGSMSMLIIEKREDVGTLAALGADRGMIRRIFVTEGWLISLLGLAAGLTAGIAAALVQQHFGIIKMPGNFALQAYPVVLQFPDILLTLTAVSLIGLLTALAAAGKADFS